MFEIIAFLLLHRRKSLIFLSSRKNNLNNLKKIRVRDFKKCILFFKYSIFSTVRAVLGYLK